MKRIEIETKKKKKMITGRLSLRIFSPFCLTSDPLKLDIIPLHAMLYSKPEATRLMNDTKFVPGSEG